MSAPALPPPQTDPAAMFPEIVQWRDAVRRGDWSRIRSMTDAMPDVESVIYAIGHMTAVDGSEMFLAQVLATHPHDVLAMTMLANRYIGLGWQIRTDKRAKNVSREQFAGMHAHLRTAERLLIDAVALEPGFAPAWKARITTAMGLELGQSEAARRYRQLARYHPHSYDGQASYLQQLCPKWSGSWEKAEAFTRECATTASDGATNGIVLLEYHLERWLDLPTDEDDAYLRQPSVLQDIEFVALRSVLHPQARRDYEWYLAHSTFAMLWSQVDMPDRAAVHFRALGNFRTVYPWNYLREPVATYDRYRSEALAKG